MLFGKRTALLVVDVQNDFVAGGSLAVPDGGSIIPGINELMASSPPIFEMIVLTQDWHPSTHSSFASNHQGANAFDEITLPTGVQQVLWPDHCVQDSIGAQFCGQLAPPPTHVVVQKGTQREVDSYSGFWDNAKGHQTDLEATIKSQGIAQVAICGLATDFCVGFTALDALDASFATILLTDLSRGIKSSSTEVMLQQIARKGGIVISSSKLMSQTTKQA